MFHKNLPQWIVFLCLLSICLIACGKASADQAPSNSVPELDKPMETISIFDTTGEIEISEDLIVRQVQPGVFIITHSFPWPANSVLVEMENAELVLVDTPYTPDATNQLLLWLEEHFGNRKITAINTGFHNDNLGGNSALIEQGIPIHGADLTAQLLEERGEAMRAMMLDWLQAPENQRFYAAHKTAPYVAPNHLFAIDDGLELKFEDETVQVYYPGPSQAPDKVAVYFPSRKLLFGSCMIIGWGDVGNISDADLALWPESVQNLSQFEFDLLVPGHGERHDPDLLNHTINLLENLQGSIEK